MWHLMCKSYVVLDAHKFGTIYRYGYMLTRLMGIPLKHCQILGSNNGGQKSAWSHNVDVGNYWSTSFTLFVWSSFHVERYETQARSFVVKIYMARHQKWSGLSRDDYNPKCVTVSCSQFYLFLEHNFTTIQPNTMVKHFQVSNRLHRWYIPCFSNRIVFSTPTPGPRPSPIIYETDTTKSPTKVLLQGKSDYCIWQWRRCRK